MVLISFRPESTITLAPVPAQVMWSLGWDGSERLREVDSKRCGENGFVTGRPWFRDHLAILFSRFRDEDV